MDCHKLWISYNPNFPGAICVQPHFTHDNAVKLLREVVAIYEPEVELVETGEVQPQNGMFRSAYYTLRPKRSEDLAQMRRALHDGLTGKARARYIWPDFEVVSQ